MAEKEGKTVDLLVVPGVDPFDAMVQTADKLQASRLVTGVSPRMDSEELARRIGVDAAALQQTLERYNADARQNLDREFGKGGNAYNRYMGDPLHRPHRLCPHTVVYTGTHDTNTAAGWKLDHVGLLSLEKVK